MKTRLTRAEIYGKLVGRTLVRNVLFKKHYYWKHRGYAFGVEHLRCLENNMNIQSLQINEVDTGKTYSIAYDLFMEKSQIIVHPNYGKQRMICIDYLTLEN